MVIFNVYREDIGFEAVGNKDFLSIPIFNKIYIDLEISYTYV